jgi:hypothetical protein
MLDCTILIVASSNIKTQSLLSEEFCVKSKKNWQGPAIAA